MVSLRVGAAARTVCWGMEKRKNVAVERARALVKARMHASLA